MRERESIVVSGVLCVLLLAWLGFFVHRSPLFPGSGLGAVFGIVGAALMLAPLGYTLAKRIPFLRARMGGVVSTQSLMILHVYAGIIGPVFALIHTGHRFDSVLGISLTAFVLLVVINGYAVRYLLAYITHEIAEKMLLLQTARGDLDNAWGALARISADAQALPATPILTAGLASFGLAPASTEQAVEVVRLATSVADLEYAIRMHEVFKRWFAWSLQLHIASSIIFYVLLVGHIASGIYFGLRWLP